jgi:DeoR/GlpR family transcriptional regulator of sugar metabolism
MLEDRQQKILEILAQKEQVTVVELGETFNVSPVTIRTDLNQLAEIGKVVRTHGGARLVAERMRQELTYATRQRINADQKRLIGETAAALVCSEDAVLLDASTTAVAVGTALKRRTDLENVTIVTTGIWTALDLLGTNRFNVVLAGGQLRETTGSITGILTEEILSRFNFAKVFLGAWGVTLKEGATDTPLEEVELKQKIVARSKSVYIVADGSKFGRLGLASFASPQEITGIVTDPSAPEDEITAFQNMGIEVSIISG